MNSLIRTIAIALTLALTGTIATAAPRAEDPEVTAAKEQLAKARNKARLAKARAAAQRAQERVACLEANPTQPKLCSAKRAK